MSDTRLNSIIRAFESGKPAFAAFSKLDKQTAIEMSDAPYDGIVFEMEHNPYDVSALGDALQYMHQPQVDCRIRFGSRRASRRLPGFPPMASK